MEESTTGRQHRRQGGGGGEVRGRPHTTVAMPVLRVGWDKASHTMVGRDAWVGGWVVVVGAWGASGSYVTLHWLDSQTLPVTGGSQYFRLWCGRRIHCDCGVTVV